MDLRYFQSNLTMFGLCEKKTRISESARIFLKTWCPDTGRNDMITGSISTLELECTMVTRMVGW